MGLVAEFEIHCTDLPLVSSIGDLGDVDATLELQYNHGDRPLFLVTVTGSTRRRIEMAFTEAYDVEDWMLIGEADETRRYQAIPALSLEEQLGESIANLEDLKTLARTDAIIERIEVTSYGWCQTGWFATRDTFKGFSSFWRENAGFRLLRLTRGGEPESPGEGLTDRQREALRTAYELGYFDIPRRTSLEEIGEELDVSSSSVSERLRRAQTQLIEETVGPTWPPLPE
jgi:hypothetical protein